MLDPSQGHSEHTTGHGALLVMVCLSLLLSSIKKPKHLEPTSSIATPEKSTWKQEKPLNCKGTNSSFMQEEKCLLMQCLCPLCDKQCHNMDTGYAHPGFYTETAQLSCTKGCSCSACVKTAMVTMCRHNAHFSKLLVQH